MLVPKLLEFSFQISMFSELHVGIVGGRTESSNSKADHSEWDRWQIQPKIAFQEGEHMVNGIHFNNCFLCLGKDWQRPLSRIISISLCYCLVARKLSKRRESCPLMKGKLLCSRLGISKRAKLCQKRCPCSVWARRPRERAVHKHIKNRIK